MEEEVEETKISKYNQALGQLMRLDNLWRTFHNLVLKGSLQQADFVLDRVWGELSGDTRTPDETGKKENDDKLSKFIDKGIIDKTKKLQFYKALMEKETFLRKLQNKQGKGTAYQDEDDFE